MSVGGGMVAWEPRTRAAATGTNDHQPLRGPTGTSNNAQTLVAERSWRWRESNPRPRTTVRGFYERSLR